MANRQGFKMEWNQADPGSVSALAQDAEIVANLWYVIDFQGFIYSLRVKTYVFAGSDEQKLAFLNSRAYLDYPVARPFSIPKRFSTNFVGAEEETKYAVIHHDAARMLGGVEQLFFDALDTMQADLPAQTMLRIPESPLIKITALHGSRDGKVIPVDQLVPGQETE